MPKERQQSTEMTSMQHAFVTAYLELGAVPERGKKAAIQAGYSPATASQQAGNLMSEKKYPLVVAAIRKGLKEINDKAILSASQVLRYIHTVMTFKPVDWFLPGGDGGWLVSMEDFRVLPDEIRQIIEEVEFKTVTREDETTTMAWIRFVSKTTAMALAARHQLGEKKDTNITIQQIDWTSLIGRLPIAGAIARGEPGQTIRQLSPPTDSSTQSNQGSTTDSQNGPTTVSVDVATSSDTVISSVEDVQDAVVTEEELDDVGRDKPAQSSYLEEDEIEATIRRLEDDGKTE